MKLIGICLLATGLMMAQEKSRQAADHSKQSDSSAGKGSDAKAKSESKAADQRPAKQQSEVKSPRDTATGQASGR